MKNTKIRTIVFAGLGLSVVPLVLLILFLLQYTVRKNDDNTRALLSESHQAVVSSLNSSLQSIRNSSDRILRHSAFLYYTNSSEVERVSRSADDLLNSFQQELSLYPEYAGLILYHKKAGRVFHSFSSPDYVKCLESAENELSAFESPRAARYKVLDISDEPFLLYEVSQRYGSVGILVDPGKNRDYASSRAALPGEYAMVLRTSPASSDKRAEFINTSLEDFPLFLQSRMPKSSFRSHLDGVQKVSLALLVLMTSVIVLVFLYMHLQLLSPLEQLSEAFEQIREGALDYRLQTRSRLDEINRFYDHFNGMLDDIREAEDESHRQQLDAMQAKLQYLQLQIRPHFYLNCLKNINSLASVHEDEKIQELVIFLSDYFRYNFQDVRNFVTIREELEAVQSYVNLCRCLYYHLDLSMDIDSVALNVKCLPMTILTFVENCIKHGGNIRTLDIRITAAVRMNDDEEPEAVIEVRNSGAFPEDTLEELNHASQAEVSYGRDHVGIKNVRYRYFLIYGEKASIRFSNDHGFAVVTTIIPVEADKYTGGSNELTDDR